MFWELIQSKFSNPVCSSNRKDFLACSPLKLDIVDKKGGGKVWSGVTGKMANM